jgi:hypothetical protein
VSDRESLRVIGCGTDPEIRSGSARQTIAPQDMRLPASQSLGLAVGIGHLRPRVTPLQCPIIGRLLLALSRSRSLRAHSRASWRPRRSAGRGRRTLLHQGRTGESEVLPPAVRVGIDRVHHYRASSSMRVELHCGREHVGDKRRAHPASALVAIYVARTSARSSAHMVAAEETACISPGRSSMWTLRTKRNSLPRGLKKLS